MSGVQKRWRVTAACVQVKVVDAYGARAVTLLQGNLLPEGTVQEALDHLLSLDGFLEEIEVTSS